MGQDGWEETEGYMLSGDFPTFKIYIASTNEYYAAEPSENFPWANLSLNVIDALVAIIMQGCTDPYATTFDSESTFDYGRCE